MAVANRQQYIRLKWSEKQGKTVLVEDADEDRFSVTMEEAIEACKAYDTEKRALVRKQFKQLLDLLGQWSYEWKGKLARVFLTVRDAGLLFLVVMKRKTYDESFENELTRLDLNVAQEDGFSEIALSVQALPNCSKENYESFCSSEGTLEYKGLNAKRSSTHPTSLA